MNEKELGELRRRFRPDKNNADTVCGCYVNEKKEIVSSFRTSLQTMPVEEAEQYFSLFRKTLTGVIGKTLIDVNFSNDQVLQGEEHGLLMRLRDSGLSDGEAVEQFFAKAAAALDLDGSYVLLLTWDSYDVPSYSKDGELDTTASDTMFRYLVCAVCPVKLNKPFLRFDTPSGMFQTSRVDSVAGAPKLGFLFPAFDDRQANLYAALYCCRDLTDNHKEFAGAVFHAELPAPADEQKGAFEELLCESLQEECDYGVVQSVHDTFLARVEEHKENKDEELRPITKSELRETLASNGVSEAKLKTFEEHYDRVFGDTTAINPQNMLKPGAMRLEADDVKVRVSADRSDLIETRLIDGIPYVVIRAASGVTVNGIPISVRAPKKEE